ncbi:hypothetical protein Tco_1156651 [Tanacetum coccineum]
MVISSPCLTDIKNWLVQKQTTFGKDFSNPFTANSLLKLYGSQLTMLHSKELASPNQTALGKDISNPLIVGSLLKTIWLSVHHVYSMDSIGYSEQTATNWKLNQVEVNKVWEDCWVLEDFTTYCCWFNIGAASEDLVLLRKIEENRLSVNAKSVLPGVVEVNAASFVRVGNRSAFGSRMELFLTTVYSY